MESGEKKQRKETDKKKGGGGRRERKKEKKKEREKNKLVLYLHQLASNLLKPTAYGRETILSLVGTVANCPADRFIDLFRESLCSIVSIRYQGNHVMLCILVCFYVQLTVCYFLRYTIFHFFFDTLLISQN